MLVVGFQHTNGSPEDFHQQTKKFASRASLLLHVGGTFKPELAKLFAADTWLAVLFFEDVPLLLEK